MAESYGIKVGTNLNTNTRQQLKLSSEFSTFKIYKWNSVQLTTNGSSEGYVDITHDLGYSPFARVMIKATAQYPFLSATTYPNAFSRLDRYNPYVRQSGAFYFDVDDTRLRISTFPSGIGGFGIGVASPNTTYTFWYMLCVDLADIFSDQSNISLTGDYGFKVSKPGISVLDGEEYEMAYSSKYSSLQYYENHIEGETLTLPVMWANNYDTYEEAATYVDFNHNLGYPPFFIAYSTHFDAGFGSGYFEEPAFANPGFLGVPKGLESVSAWCDSSRVRITFSRYSQYSSSTELDYGAIFAERTVFLRVAIFAFDLTGPGSP